MTVGGDPVVIFLGIFFVRYSYTGPALASFGVTLVTNILRPHSVVIPHTAANKKEVKNIGTPKQ